MAQLKLFCLRSIHNHFTMTAGAQPEQLVNGQGTTPAYLDSASAEKPNNKPVAPIVCVVSGRIEPQQQFISRLHPTQKVFVRVDKPSSPVRNLACFKNTY